MTKKEIVKTISDEMQLTQLKTKEIVQKTFDAIVETLVTERRIELRNFGVFEVKKRAARKARNPRTGERVDVGEKFVVTFKPGKEMEERVRQLDQVEASSTSPPSQNQPAASSSDEQSAVRQPVPPEVAGERRNDESYVGQSRSGESAARSDAPASEAAPPSATPSDSARPSSPAPDSPLSSSGYQMSPYASGRAE